MEFNLIYASKVREEMQELEKEYEYHVKEVKKALEILAHDPRHPGLHTHKYENMHGENREEIFESYAENHTPGAYRIFWHYGPGRNFITITDIKHHP